MIAVIQCAASKRAHAGYMRTRDGRSVLFVANPADAPSSTSVVYARPDDPCDWDCSWRDAVLRYNEAPGNNPLCLYPAFELYVNDTYRRLVERLGVENTFILSAGWGLISASFLTPAYDITFSVQAETYKRRRKRDRYQDWCMLSDHEDDEILFFGGKDYLPGFVRLTSHLRCRRTVFYNSMAPLAAPGCSLKRFVTKAKTNWHYECARRFLDGQSMEI